MLNIFGVSCEVARQTSYIAFELLIDWSWFYFITKPPLFVAMEWLFRYFGNFGVAILLITVLITPPSPSPASREG
jgi:membrane protein insertase Oxa1/YidC/SpoIIIJ